MQQHFGDRSVFDEDWMMTRSRAPVVKLVPSEAPGDSTAPQPASPGVQEVLSEVEVAAGSRHGRRITIPLGTQLTAVPRPVWASSAISRSPAGERCWAARLAQNRFDRSETIGS
jgi:hypothetical protein